MAEAKEPIRVLHIIGRMDRGGIETMLMNIYRNIDRTKVQFDFLAHYGREAAYNEEIRAMGGRIYEMPALKTDDKVYYWRYFQYVQALHAFFREHREYKIIHGHMTNTASIYMPIAKKYGVTCRIAHSHSTKGKAGLLGKVTVLLQSSVSKWATDWFACSEAAAQWLYPRDAVKNGQVKLISNAVDAEKFRFDPALREQIRREMDLEGKLVIGCVGRFRREKNQGFLVRVMAELTKLREDAVLLLVGEGPFEETVKAQARELGVEQCVRFLGMREDIHLLMQVMDMFALPSLWEGLPVVAVEAQASGLHCVASAGVPRETDALGGMVDFVSLEDPLDCWTQAILKAAALPREDTLARVRAAGFDIHTTVPWLQEFYLQRG